MTELDKDALEKTLNNIAVGASSNVDWYRETATQALKLIRGKE